MTVLELKKELESNEELKAKLKGISDLDEVVRIVNEAGFDIKKEAFQELSDDNLDEVAGGGAWKYMTFSYS